MPRLPIHRRMIVLGFLPLLASLAVFGCGGGKGYRVSGKVTFKNEPIAAGKIYFIPDTTKGNSGATGYADIVNGAYDTDAPGGMGSVGGAMIVRIEAVDPSHKGKPNVAGEVSGKALFPAYEVKMDLPNEATTKDIDVPADAAKGRKQQKAGVP